MKSRVLRIPSKCRSVVSPEEKSKLGCLRRAKGAAISHVRKVFDLVQRVTDYFDSFSQRRNSWLVFHRCSLAESDLDDGFESRVDRDRQPGLYQLPGTRGIKRQSDARNTICICPDIQFPYLRYCDSRNEVRVLIFIVAFPNKLPEWSSGPFSGRIVCSRSVSKPGSA